jgi:ABC-2 type transport system permease protein
MVRIRRYLGLFRIFVRVGLMSQMAYRPHFFMMIAGKVIRIGLLVLFFQAIFSRVMRIGDWTFDNVLLLFATFHVVDYLMSITFQRNLSSNLPSRVHTGELDYRMILPVNLLFFVSLEDVDMMDFFSFLPTLLFLVYVFYRLDFAFSPLQFILYIALVANAMTLIIATMSFWTTQSYGLAVIFDNLMKIGRYPLDIFGGFWRVIFIYFLPLVLIAQVPTQAILGTLTPSFVLFSFAVSGMVLTAALFFWRRGVRNYLSAST